MYGIIASSCDLISSIYCFIIDAEKAEGFFIDKAIEYDIKNLNTKLYDKR